jgi:hypothetical protein
MFEMTFEHYGKWFGIVVDDWGDPQGAGATAAALKQYVIGLDGPCVKSLHLALTESDAAFGDDPIFDSPAISDLYAAIQIARNTGLDASEEPLNTGRRCTCQLVPLPGQP